MTDHPLFEWLALLAVATARKKLSVQQAGIALLIALTSKGTTGERAFVDADALATETGLSVRTIWRHFSALTVQRDDNGQIERDGWFEQTEKPKRPGPGQQARRARYRLTRPALDLALATDLSALASSAPLDDTGCVPPTSQRVSLSNEPCAISERDDGTVTPSLGTPDLAHPSINPHPDARASDDDASRIRIRDDEGAPDGKAAAS